MNIMLWYTFFKKHQLQLWLMGCTSAEMLSNIMDDYTYCPKHPNIRIRIENEIIATNCVYAYNYAFYNNRRFHAGEPMIATQLHTTYNYAKFIIKGPWPKADDIFLQDSWWALHYVIDVVDKRYPKLENIIKQDREMKEKYENHFRVTI